MVSVIQMLEELIELEMTVHDNSHPRTAMKIAASRISIAETDTTKENMQKAENALRTAQRVYELYSRGDVSEPLRLTEGMKNELYRDHPQHYLLEDH